MRNRAFVAAAAIAFAGAAQAVTVDVSITGEVEFNQVNDPPLGDVQSGDMATLTFTVQSDVFDDSLNFPTRGYLIDQSSFVLTLGSVSVGLADPFPAGQTPYFVIRNNDPAVDGFFTSTNLDFPFGVPLDEPGIFGDFLNNFRVTYQGDTLDSLDILGALGTYDFDGLTVFGWSIDDGPFEAMFIIFTEMTISAELGMTVPLDIKPGSCPNSFNPRRRGVLPMALLGTGDFDVAEIDVSTIQLSRADGVGGSVMPIRTSYEDVGTPFDGEPCDCGEMEDDGYMDLTMKFRSPDVVSTLELTMSMGGDAVELVVSGSLLDGTPFAGFDCIHIPPHGGPGGSGWMAGGGPSNGK